ncbi:MAG: hypothetical protein JXR40_10560, partial [Pontiellaceae bacterium]|nr:hypothetical protein [Pontiellaceae bacterium]
RGQGSIFGEGLLTIATLGAGFADDAGTVGRIGNMTRKLDAALPDEVVPRGGIFQTGVNVTPRSVANEFRTIGSGGRTFVTEPSAVENIVGSLNQSQIKISAQQARMLENALGLNANSLEVRNIISVIDDIPSRSPGSPITGNSLFQGRGAGLPGGGSELTIQGIPSAGGSGIRQIILEVGN